MLRRPVLFAAAVATSLFALSPSLRADMIPDGKTFVPVMLTLEGQDAFKDTTFVLAGCSSENGRHYVAVAKPKEILPCRVKGAAVVHAIPTADRKAFDDLVAKDLGWGEEGMEARKLLEKATECGKVEENALVDTSAGIKEIAAKYALEKTESGCSLKKVSSTNVLVNGAATNAPTSSAAPVNAPTSSAAAAAPTPSAPPAKQGGCATAASPAPTGSGAAFFAIAAGLFVIARRRARSAPTAISGA